MKMAGNEGEGRRLNRLLQIAREQEDINRQLKGTLIMKHEYLKIISLLLLLSQTLECTMIVLVSKNESSY